MLTPLGLNQTNKLTDLRILSGFEGLWRSSSIFNNYFINTYYPTYI